ncbi:MAG: hypothetical protein IJS65_05165 [Clostridia bacterium]|nr:hypothetical protein [Clostridia bacterium]
MSPMLCAAEKPSPKKRILCSSFQSFGKSTLPEAGTRPFVFPAEEGFSAEGAVCEGVCVPVAGAVPVPLPV